MLREEPDSVKILIGYRDLSVLGNVESRSYSFEVFTKCPEVDANGLREVYVIGNVSKEKEDERKRAAMRTYCGLGIRRSLDRS